MNFQDELRKNMRTPSEALAQASDMEKERIRQECVWLLDKIKETLKRNANQGTYTVSSNRATVSCVCPVPQKYLKKQRMDNGDQLAANSKRGLFRDRSLIYRVWYSFSLNSQLEREYQLFCQILKELAKQDNIQADIVLFDKRTHTVHPFPCSIEGFQFDRDFELSAKAVTHIIL